MRRIWDGMLTNWQSQQVNLCERDGPERLTPGQPRTTGTGMRWVPTLELLSKMPNAREAVRT